MPHFSAIFLGVAAIASVANAHLVMSHPEPYAFSQLPNGPIDPQIHTSMFPCAGASGKTDMPASGATPMTAGDVFPVNFTGSAVHGGGSCQFSVTYDFPPPADPSKWKVLHSQIGGCPASAMLNLPELPQADEYGHATGTHCKPSESSTGYECLRSFNIDIPQELKNGQATFAWTWFNRLGNREMYMNCAPVEISGGSDDDAFLDTLPEIFVANAKTVMGEQTCATEVGGVQTFPNPGPSVSTDLSAPEGPDFTTLDGPSSCKYGRAGSAGNADADSGDDKPVADKPAASPAAPVDTPAASPNPGAVFAPGAGAGAAPAPSTPSAVVPKPVVAPAPSAAPIDSSPAPVVAPPATGGNATDKVACPTDGVVVCISATQFGLCDHGFAVPQALAAGTSCTAGVISKRSSTHKHLGAHKRRMANLL